MVKCATKAYEKSLKQYHGWMVQGIFSVSERCVYVCIYRDRDRETNWMKSYRVKSRGGGYSHIIWVGVCCWVCESPTLYQSKFCKFCDPIP